MTKLAKYLKPFGFGVLLAFVLLFGQAMCDLNLPNLMSNIVNVGIQQNGMEHAAPDAISKDGMKMIQTFMPAKDQKLVNDSYRLVKGSAKNSNGKTYNSIYKKINGKQIYARKSNADVKKLDTTFGVASWTFIDVMKNIAKQEGKSINTNTSTLKNIDFKKLYAMQPMLDQLRAYQPQVIYKAHDKAAKMDNSLLSQSGIAFSKAFYQDLGGNVNNLQSGYIIRVGLLMLLVAILGGIATVLVSLIASRIAAGVARNLRKDLFNKVGEFSNEEYDNFSTASLITRSTNDITQIQMVLMIGIRMVCYAPIMAAGGIFMSVRKSASMAWIIALACLVMLCLIILVFIIAVPKFKLIQKLVDRLNLVARENLTGLMVVRAFGTEGYEKGRFDEANTSLMKTNLFVNRVMVFMMPIMMLVMNGITILVVWNGAHQIASSSIQVGDMMAFMQYAMQVIMAFLMISMMFIMVPRAAVSAGRVAEVLETEPSIVDPKAPKQFEESKKGVVEFRNVNFRYKEAEEDALGDISFCAQPGQTTAFIGATGSGKSTIANLLLRFYDVTGGEILVDGADVRDVTQEDLHRIIGYIPQRAELLSGTISSNLKYGNKDATDEELAIYAAVAQATEFIDEKPEGFESEIAQSGGNVSGGQKQRLSIARALVKKPEIFIFDDSFSALDFKTDVALRRALKEKTGDSTIILVAQRISTIMSAEQIIVLEHGKIVGRGTHRELLETCPQYYEIASSQLSKEELA